MATALEIAPFENEPLTDWTIGENVEQMRAALAQVRSEFSRTYPLVIGDRRIEGGEPKASINPANKTEVVGLTAQCTSALAKEAISVADEAFRSWSAMMPEQRADIVLRAAALLRERRFEFAATMVYEVSKSWPEADADVAELIDFAEYYARQALRFAGPQPVVPLAGERNEYVYLPLGVGAVIPPWNFPSAIMGGMTLAAIAAGNTVVLKPASTSPVIAAKFVDLLIDGAGLPPGVVNFIPGPGSEIGDVIVDHPRTRFIAFTGSKEVGLRIFERAAKVNPGQIWLKRTVLEMGGKDGIVVDETADLNDAADGIVKSAFGFQGQKCSACSRAIIVDEVYDEVLEKVVEQAGKLRQGDPSEPETYVGAVIDGSAFRKINEYIEIGQTEGRLVLGGSGPDPEQSGGYFIPPTIIADVAPDARIAQEEIFGPVVAFIRARDFDHAIEIANGTEFGLTGSLYSQDEDRLRDAARRFHVGNLYFNRKCTGALVGAHPFGGFNMSGTDSKAGGPDYLALFLQAKSIARKL